MVILGYEVVIEDCDLKYAVVDEEKVFRALKHGKFELSDFWLKEENRIVPSEGWFKWGDWFEEDLKKMAKAGVSGSVEVRGEQGECNKFVLRNGRVEVYYARITYPKIPDEILE